MNLYHDVWWHVTQMMNQKSGPLQSGSREARYVLIDEQGVEMGPAGTLSKIRERRDELQSEYELHVVREDRTVVPDGADVDTLGVADLGVVNGALTADHAMMTGVADELDAERPHHPRNQYLYDVAEALRHRARRVESIREQETARGWN